jgi:hypothetical protein
MLAGDYMIRGKERFLTQLYVGVDFIFIQMAFFVVLDFSFLFIR